MILYKCNLLLGKYAIYVWLIFLVIPCQTFYILITSYLHFKYMWLVIAWFFKIILSILFLLKDGIVSILSCYYHRHSSNAKFARKNVYSQCLIFFFFSFSVLVNRYALPLCLRSKHLLQYPILHMEPIALYNEH